VDTSGDLSNNAAIISNFSLGLGGSLDDTTISPTGDVNGNLDTSPPLTLTDAAPTSDFHQQFTPGTAISFMLDLTTNVGPHEDQSMGGTPDQFSFTVYSDLTDPITGPQQSAILSIDITGNPPTIVTDDGGMVSGLSQPFFPVATLESTATPEPSTFTLIALGLLGLTTAGRRQRKVEGA